MAALTKLEYLVLFGNQITAIAGSLTTLTNLKGLYLSWNQITAIPDSLAALTRLQYPFLDGNQITAVPDSLVGLPEALNLELGENPLPGELAEVARLGRRRLRGYLKERARDAFWSTSGRRPDESGRGTHECVRHTAHAANVKLFLRGS